MESMFGIIAFMNESESAIQRAEAFLGEASQLEPIQMNLPPGCVSFIQRSLDLQFSIERVFTSEWDRRGIPREQLGVPLGHEESMLSVLYKRFSDVKDKVERSTLQAQGSPISIQLNSREMDYLNRIILKPVGITPHEWKTYNYRKNTSSLESFLPLSLDIENMDLQTTQDTEEDEGHNVKPELGGLVQERLIEQMTKQLAYFMVLNREFLRSGGEIRPEFIDWYDGEPSQ